MAALHIHITHNTYTTRQYATYIERKIWEVRSVPRLRLALLVSFIYRDSWEKFAKSLTLIVNFLFYFTVRINCEEHRNILSTTTESCLIFQFSFPFDTYAGPKPSVASNPAWLLLEHLPSYKTGVQFQQRPNEQFLATIPPLSPYLPVWHSNLRPMRQYLLHSNSNNFETNSAKRNFPYLTTVYAGPSGRVV